MNVKTPPQDQVPWASNSGLFNSASFVVDMLNASGVSSRLIQINNNFDDINIQIVVCNPTDVIFEAFFVPPETLKKLSEAHPTIRFFVRNHSEMPMLAYDSRASEWMAEYLRNPQMHMASNTTRSVDDLRHVVQSYFPHWDVDTLAHRVVYMPNYHPAAAPLSRIPSQFNVLNVGCFGAVRPQKNQFMQAICAIAVARELGKKLQFHMNGTRVLHQGGGILRNIRGLFAKSPNAKLVEHEWLARPQFLDLCPYMDIGMQVSLTETFNIVTADLVQNNIPVVVSTEIPWCDKRIQANPTNGAEIVNKMQIALRASSIVASNRNGLLKYNNHSHDAWMSVIGKESTGYTHRQKSFKARPAITSYDTHL